MTKKLKSDYLRRVHVVGKTVIVKWGKIKLTICKTRQMQKEVVRMTKTEKS